MSMFDDRLIPADAAPGAGPPNLADNTYRVNPTTKLANAFLWVKNFADGQPEKKLSMLNILCHGFYNWAESDELQESTMVGGFGLQLCAEGLLVNNIATIVPLVKDKLAAITIYACGAGSGQANGPQNGRTFCQDLADKLNCVVFAADRKQVFHYSRVSPMALDFGEWEGTVTQYNPKDKPAVVGRFSSPNST